MSSSIVRIIRVSISCKTGSTRIVPGAKYASVNNFLKYRRNGSNVKERERGEKGVSSHDSPWVIQIMTIIQTFY